MQNVLSSNRNIPLISSKGLFNGQYTFFCSKVSDCKTLKFSTISVIGPRLDSGTSFLIDLFLGSFSALSHSPSVQNKEIKGITIWIPKSMDFPYHISLLDCGECKTCLSMSSKSQFDEQHKSLVEHIGSFISIASNVIIIDATETRTAEFKACYSIFLRSVFSTYCQFLNNPHNSVHNTSFKLISFVIVRQIDQEINTIKDDIHNILQEIFVESIPKDCSRTFHDSVYLQIVPLSSKEVNPRTYWQQLHDIRNMLESTIAAIQRPDNLYGQLIFPLADSPRIFCKIWEHVLSNKISEIYTIYTTLGDNRCKIEGNECYLCFSNAIKWVETLVHEVRRVPSVTVSELSKRTKECNTFRLFQDLITVSSKAILKYDQLTGQYMGCSRDKWRIHLCNQIMGKIESIAKELAAALITSMLSILHAVNNDIRVATVDWNGQGDLPFISEDLTKDGIDVLCQLLNTAGRVYNEYKGGYQIEVQAMVPSLRAQCDNILEEQFSSTYLDNVQLGVDIQGIYESLRFLHAGILSWCYKTVSPLGKFCNISQLLHNAKEEADSLCTEAINSFTATIDRIIDIQIRQSYLPIQESISLVSRDISDRINILCEDLLTKAEGPIAHILNTFKISLDVYTVDKVMVTFIDTVICAITTEIKRMFDFKEDFINRLSKYIDTNFVNECRNQSLYQSEQVIEDRYLSVKKEIENYLSAFTCIVIVTRYKTTSIAVVTTDTIQSILERINDELVKKCTIAINNFSNSDIKTNDVEMVDIPIGTISSFDG